MAFFSGRNTIFNSLGEHIRRSKRLGKEQLQYLVKELAHDLEQGETLLQSLPIGIVLLNKNFHLQLMNRAARRCPLFSMSQFPSSHNTHSTHNIRGKQRPIWHHLSHQELAGWLEDELQGEGVSQAREFLFFGDDNELSVTRIEISSQVRNGTIEGWIILITDTSELRQQERKLQQLDILASFSTVTAGVAHEIKNPLAAMSLHVQLMQRLLKKKETIGPQMLEYCAIIQEEIERLNNFVTDFLLAVRPLELELVSQPLDKSVAACLELLQPELQAKGILLELEFAQDLPNVALDPAMFKHLLLNLVQNAIQAIEEKAEKLVHDIHGAYQGKLCIRSYHKNAKVYLEFIDNGCGMSNEIRRKILEPFFTTRAKGTGLGMTMVLRILQTHNGDLQIQSEEGAGSILRIEFPIFQQQQKLLLERSLV